MQYTFDGAEIARGLQRGTAIVQGSAFLRQQGGGVVTCAGNEVRLYPATKFTTERLRTMFRTGTDDGPRISLDRSVHSYIDPGPDEFFAAIRKTRCDVAGKFEFPDVADGDYWIETTVRWLNGPIREGGALAARFKVQGGISAPVVVTYY